MDSGCCHTGERRLLSLALLPLLLSLAFLVAAAGQAAAQLPVPTNCQVDLDGANDEPGQKDLTQYCVDVGSGPYALNTLWSWDDEKVPGGNTGDACSLYDTDGDGLVNLAVCVTTRDHGLPMTLGATRLFTCNDTKADRCAGQIQVTGNQCVGGADDGAACSGEADCDYPGVCVPVGAGRTTCEVVQTDTDPFPAGDNYPVRRVLGCEL